MLLSQHCGHVLSGVPQQSGGAAATPGTGRVDVLVSEPMGRRLVNERMLETYLYARRPLFEAWREDVPR